MKQIFFILVLVLTFTGLSYSQEVYYGKIDGEIDLTVAAYVKRVITTANEKHATAVLLEINTFGGRVDAAVQIKDAILTSKTPVYAFINKRAVSAGALIALSCSKIAISSGGLIGAATVVNQEGEKLSEKYQSYMRSEMRSTAEKNNRNKLIAEGMVDEKIVAGDFDDDKSLVSLSSTEAIKYCMADTVAESKESAMAVFGINKPTFVAERENSAEKFVGFLNKPLVSSILIMIGIIGLFLELKAPGWTVPGTVSVIALLLFFGSSYILNLASFFDILLFVIGVLLLAVEIFLIPGFGITGVSGILLIVASLFLSLFDSNMPLSIELLRRVATQLGLTFFATAAILALIYKYLPKSKSFKKFVLETSNQVGTGLNNEEKFDSLVGREAVAFTTLRPAGVVLLDDEKFDVITDGSFIEKGETVIIEKVSGIKIIVRKVSNT